MQRSHRGSVTGPAPSSPSNAVRCYLHTSTRATLRCRFGHTAYGVSTRSIGMVTGFRTVRTDILPVASNYNLFTLTLHVPLIMLLVRMRNL